MALTDDPAPRTMACMIFDELVKSHHMTAKKKVRVQGAVNPEE
ncbi:hypothetical protein [Desulfatiferula olefinivorans]